MQPASVALLSGKRGIAGLGTMIIWLSKKPSTSAADGNFWYLACSICAESGQCSWSSLHESNSACVEFIMAPWLYSKLAF